MTTPAPTFGQIKALAAAIRKKDAKRRAIGIRVPGRWQGAPTQQDGAETYLISQCDSPLAMRLALREPADDATRILLTGLEDKDLSDDILVRLAKSRLFEIDNWQIVRSLFQAHAVDPRLTRQAWIAEQLLNLVPPAGYPPAQGGFLDAETAWPLLLNLGCGLAADNPDLTTLLRWSLDENSVARFQGLPEQFRAGAIAWLAERAGPAAEVILRCIERLERPDAVPLGIVAGVVFHPTTAGRLERAAVKLEERYLGGQSPDPAILGRWSAAAADVVRLQLTDPRAKRQVVGRADEILGELQAEKYAYVSDLSPLGFVQRLAQLGQQLTGIVERGAYDMLDGLRLAKQAARDHDQASREGRRLERVEMALRLMRWLAGEHATATQLPRSLAEAATRQLHEGGYVDWARLSLRAGDPVHELSEAYSRLFELVTQRREQQARQFGQLLKDWTAAGSQGDDVLPVEQILERVVAPLAAAAPVLVIVIDGMSVAVYRELLADLTRHDWLSLCEPQRPFTRPGLATIPSVTEFSRTSLLCGRLQQGSSADEKVCFAEHPALLAHSRSGTPPVLFHKASLQDEADTILAAEVRKEIESSHRRVVGVVVNAVDDHLFRGEQIDTRWSRDEIKILPTLLQAARDSRRLVVLLSDHGHVLESQARAQAHPESGERWRPAAGPPAADELEIQGSRVLVPGHRLIAPVSERVRYGMKKNGYHGGLTPQEMVVPIVVLSSSESFPAGWNEMPVETPAWWDEVVRGIEVREPQPPRLKPVVTPPARTLFDLGVQPAKTPTADAVPEWITQLLVSPVFEQQKRLGGRTIPPSDVISKLLIVLADRGGKATFAGLARALDYPPLRLRGLLANVQRILNVDGYAVFNRDEASDTIELNQDLLVKQFDL